MLAFFHKVKTYLKMRKCLQLTTKTVFEIFHQLLGFFKECKGWVYKTQIL
jgi:hypothetical protein